MYFNNNILWRYWRTTNNYGSGTSNKIFDDVHVDCCSLFDTGEERYKKLRRCVSQFTLMQIG